MILSVTSFQINSKGTMHYPKTFFLIAASVAVAAAVNPNGIKNRLASALSTFFIKGKPFFSNGLENLPQNPPDCPTLCN